MKHIKLFQERNEFENSKFGISRPWVALNKQDYKVHYSSDIPYIDLDLPSGLLWATCNVGAKDETEGGLFFQWGDTEGYDANEGKAHSSWDNYKYGTGLNELVKYDDVDKKNILEVKDDAVAVNVGLGWRMPTKDECEELCKNTVVEAVTDFNGSGINGMKFTSKENSDRYIFIPATGYLTNGNLNGEGKSTYLWASTVYKYGYAFAGVIAYSDFESGVDDKTRCSAIPVRGVRER